MYRLLQIVSVKNTDGHYNHRMTREKNAQHAVKKLAVHKPSKM